MIKHSTKMHTNTGKNTQKPSAAEDIPTLEAQRSMVFARGSETRSGTNKSGLGGIRTHDLRFRKPESYPD